MLDPKSLDGFPALQLAAAFIVALAGVYAIYRGIRDGKKAPPASDPAAPALVMAFDGPLQQLDRVMQRIATALEMSPAMRGEIREIGDQLYARVSDAKTVLFTEIKELEERIESDRRDQETRLRSLEQEVARLGAISRRGR